MQVTMQRRSSHDEPVVGRTSRRHRRPRPDELTDVVEGQIAEICRDLAVEAKRMRRLQEQADELCRTMRQWGRLQLVMEDDAEQ
jgi:hypothetical protein